VKALVRARIDHFIIILANCETLSLAIRHFQFSVEVCFSATVL